MSKKHPGRLWLIGHAHIDMNWVWQFPETVQVAQDTFRQVLQFIDEFPEFCFSQSQACIYEAIEKLDPELFKRIRNAVRAGRWNIVGGMWSEADTNLAGGEALARSCLLGQGYFQSRFGQEAKVGWLPDDFGHTAQLPQILRLAGMEGFLFMRCPPGLRSSGQADVWGTLSNRGRKLPRTAESEDIFWWQAPDGSRVLAKNCPTYNDIITEDLRDRLSLLPAGVQDQLVVYGVGDHGGGPTREDIRTAGRLQERDDFPKVVFSIANAYFAGAAGYGKKIPTFSSELQYIFEGCYTSIGKIKRANRYLENLLYSAELLGSIARQFGRSYRKKVLEDAWRTLCFNQFHDILCGSANNQSNAESLARYMRASEEVEFELKASLRTVAEQVDIDSARIPLVVFNTLGWQRSGMVEAEIFSEKVPEDVKVFEDNGRAVPAQIRKARLCPNGFRVWISFAARDIPSVGYKTYFAEMQTNPGGRVYQRSHHDDFEGLANTWMRMDSAAEPLLNYNHLPAQAKRGDLKAEGLAVENRWCKLTLDRRSGGISRWYDKRRKRELVRRGRIANRLLIDLEKPHHMSAWHIGPIRKTLRLNAKSVHMIQAGPAAVTFRIVSRYDQSEVVQHLTVYRDSPLIEVELQVIWLQRGSAETDAPTLRVEFPLSGAGSELICDVPFAAIYRPGNGQEVPAQKWVAVPDKTGGVALFNDGKYGHRLDKGTLSLTLLRSSYEPDPMGDVGIHLIRYGLSSYKGKWLKAGAPLMGKEFNVPILSFESRRREGRLPLQKSFLEISDPRRFLLTAYKPAENGKGLVVRGYDLAGKPGLVDITPDGKVAKARLLDILERPLAESKVRVSKAGLKVKIKPYKIITLGLVNL